MEPEARHQAGGCAAAIVAVVAVIAVASVQFSSWVDGHPSFFVNGADWAVTISFVSGYLAIVGGLLGLLLAGFLTRDQPRTRRQVGAAWTSIALLVPGVVIASMFAFLALTQRHPWAIPAMIAGGVAGVVTFGMWWARFRPEWARDDGSGRARMTGPGVPPVVVDHNGWWIAVNRDENPYKWAKSTAPGLMARWGKWFGIIRQAKLTTTLMNAAIIARKATDSNLILLLYPEADGGVKAIVRLGLIDISERDEDAAWKTILDRLDPAQIDSPDFGPPELTDLRTPAGACKRLRVRQTTPDSHQVGEHLMYLWVLPGYDSAVFLGTMFIDLDTADRWRSAVDDLAAGVGLDDRVR